MWYNGEGLVSIHDLGEYTIVHRSKSRGEMK